MTIERRPIVSRSEWLGWRQGLLTASDVPAIAGKDSFKTALRVFREKQGRVPDQPDNDAMRRGRRLEVAARETIQEENPTWLVTAPKVFLIDHEHRLGATPDCLITRPDVTGIANCQIKCVRPLSFDRDWATGIPTGVALQTATEGLLLGAQTNFVCAFVVDSRKADIALYELPRNPSVEADILAMVADFWDRFDHDRPYDPDFTRDSEVIRALYPRAEPDTVADMTGDNRLAELLPARALLKDEMTGIKKDLDAIDAEIIAKLGPNEVAELPGYRLTYKNEYTKAYTVPERNPRVLRIKQLKEDAA